MEASEVPVEVVHRTYLALLCGHNSLEHERAAVEVVHYGDYAHERERKSLAKMVMGSGLVGVGVFAVDVLAGIRRIVHSNSC